MVGRPAASEEIRNCRALDASSSYKSPARPVPAKKFLSPVISSSYFWKTRSGTLLRSLLQPGYIFPRDASEPIRTREGRAARLAGRSKRENQTLTYDLHTTPNSSRTARARNHKLSAIHLFDFRVVRCDSVAERIVSKRHQVETEDTMCFARGPAWSEYGVGWSLGDPFATPWYMTRSSWMLLNAPPQIGKTVSVRKECHLGAVGIAGEMNASAGQEAVASCVTKRGDSRQIWPLDVPKNMTATIMISIELEA